MFPLRRYQCMEDCPVPVVDGVVGNHCLLPHIVQGARYVNVGALVALVGSNSGLHGVLGVGWDLDTVRQRDDPERLPVDSPMQGCSDPDLVDVLLERHGSSQEHGRVWCVHDAYGHLLAARVGRVHHRLEVTGHEPGDRRGRVPQELPVEGCVPDAPVLCDDDRGGLVPPSIGPVLPRYRDGLEVHGLLRVLQDLGLGGGDLDRVLRVVHGPGEDVDELPGADGERLAEALSDQHVCGGPMAGALDDVLKEQGDVSAGVRGVQDTVFH